MSDHDDAGAAIDAELELLRSLTEAVGAALDVLDEPVVAEVLRARADLIDPDAPEASFRAARRGL